jgi:hypothetical protein
LGEVKKKMSEENRFKILMLIARPAAGKSEIIDYLKKEKRDLRIRRFHIGDFEEIDDFPMLWTWFEEDGILSQLGKPRIHTTHDGYFLHTYFWDLLVRRICLEYEKHIRREFGYHNRYTTIIEFSRGSEHGGFARAFHHMSREVLESSAVLYIQVSYEESLRKNRRRFNPERPDSILEHGLPDSKLELLYKKSDWDSFCSPDPEYLHVQGMKIPYAVMENEDDVTTARGEALGDRLEGALSGLWKLYTFRRT